MASRLVLYLGKKTAMLFLKEPVDNNYFLPDNRPKLKSLIVSYHLLKNLILEKMFLGISTEALQRLRVHAEDKHLCYSFLEMLFH